MVWLPFDLWRYIAYFTDDIEIRRDFGAYSPVAIPPQLKTMYHILPGISPDGTMRCILPNRLNSHERTHNNIDDDTLDLRIQIFDDYVEYHYKYYIFGKFPENMHNSHGELDMVLEIYCWQYYELIYIRY